MPLSYDDLNKIACDLLARGRIKPLWYEAWRQRKQGHSPTQIRLTMTITTYRGTQMHPTVRTISKWARNVREAIVEEREGKRVWGVTVASGSETRSAADLTPQGVLPGSTWNDDEMRKWGKLDRHSRKRR